MKFKKHFVLLCLSFLLVSFFVPSYVKGLLPIPADTIIGLYHPYRDLYANNYPNGIPFKNFLTTDPVRQQYPWKYLSINEEKKFELPLWNPYTFSGTPLLANFQAGPFYILNLVFLLFAFPIGWSIFIIAQPLLAGVFLYLLLRQYRVASFAAFIGGFVFAYSGFSVAWLEWGNIGNTALWLPLVLLCIEKLIIHDKSQEMKKIVLWNVLFIFALVNSLFAGHLQTFFYLFIVSFLYILVRWWQYGKQRKVIWFFTINYLLFVIITIPQWYPTLQFISVSARNLDQAIWQKEGWFIPWQHLVQFIAPDFFGNPSTLNYFGVWNYGEFIGYIGLLPLLFAFFAILFRRDRETIFFSTILLVGCIFALPNTVSALPYHFQIPFLATAQPTRLLFIIDFCLAVLAGLGVDAFLRTKKQSIILPLLICMGGIFIFIWGILLFSPEILQTTAENVHVAIRNMQLPTLLLFGITMILGIFLMVKNDRIRFILLLALLILTVADISRFAGKFTPFSRTEYLYPATDTISFLQKNLTHYRFVSIDSRILPPNFSVMYGLQTVEGYDPLYLQRYAELIAASERKKPDISTPLNFNRIITPHEYESRIIDLLGVKYILSLHDLTSPKVKKVFQERETRIYENTAVLPRAFFVEHVTLISDGDKKRAINFLFDPKHNFHTEAVVEVAPHAKLERTEYASGSAEIETYGPNLVSIRTKSVGEGFLVFTDSYYSTWKALIITDARKLQRVPIYRTNYAFRGVVVPPGEHVIEFTSTLF